MATEIERKFLVDSSFRPSVPGTRMVQGYLTASQAVTVRVRRAGDRAYLTIKGRTQGISRSEYEYEVPTAEAEELFLLCQTDLVEKTRYRESVGAHVFEVDIFSGKNAGLVLAEIELESETEPFDKPTWLGEEVSFDPRYTNSALSRQPYSAWSSGSESET